MAKKKELEEDRKTRWQEWRRRRQLVPSLSKEIFPKLHPSGLETLPVDQYQRVFEAYQQREQMLQPLNEEETKAVIAEWLGESTLALGDHAEMLQGLNEGASRSVTGLGVG